jgi:hypothetical protein
MPLMAEVSNVEVVRAALEDNGEIRRWLHESDANADGARLEVDELSDVDSRVLVLGRLVHDGDEGSSQVGLVCDVYKERILRWQGYRSHVEAIRAAEMAEC